MDEITADIERLGIHGEGVGTHEGCRIFIDGALPSEQVRARLHLKKKSYAKGTALAILRPSPDRVRPICPVFGVCGGCQLMHLAYPKQLEAKTRFVIDALERIGKLPDVKVSPCLASPKELYYRNKIQLPVTDKMTMGLYARGSHDIVEIEKCYIHTSLGEEAFKAVKEALKTYTLPDNLRHVLIKSAIRTGEVLVIFVTEAAPSAQLYKMAKRLPVCGVVHNKHEGGENRILGRHFTPLAGSPTINETLCGLHFKISPASFFQVNPLQAEVLYNLALEFADLKGHEVVWDAFCGVGTLSLIFARRAKKVIGVEVVAEAIEDAWENAARNSLTNVLFKQSPAEVYCTKLPFIDIALLNPPRKGCEKSLIDHLTLHGPEKIIYVSCDPATLARDLNLLCQGGYNIVKVQPVDMFPQTAHVETVVLCTQK